MVSQVKEAIMTEVADPTFYRTPGDAIAAAPESLAYVAAYDPQGVAKDAIAVLDCDAASTTYGKAWVPGWPSSTQTPRTAACRPMSVSSRTVTRFAGCGFTRPGCRAGTPPATRTASPGNGCGTGLGHRAGRVGGRRGSTGRARVRGRPGHRSAARRPATPCGGLAGRNERQPDHRRRCRWRSPSPGGCRAGAARHRGRGTRAGRPG